LIPLVGIIAFLTVLFLSLMVTKIATVALTYTGLSRQAALFQARSAFTGTGFTTSEAEKVVDHPVRRQIIMALMVARSAGLVTIVISLILSLADSAEFSRLTRLGLVVGGAAVLWLLAQSCFVDRMLSRAIRWSVQRWTHLDTRDYASLLNVHGPYQVNEFRVKEGDWLAGKSLQDCRLPDEGVTILGIYRDDGTYVGVPRLNTEIYAGDSVVLYGRSQVLRELTFRRNDADGQQAHRKAVSNQKNHESRQARDEQKYRRRKEMKPA
jgi:Trk K+ transport system NAD-binding subunit